MFTGYLKKTVQSGKKHVWELSASIALFVIIVVATINSVPPFSTTMHIGESFKESWAVGIDKAPIPHAELMTIAQFGESLALSVESVLEALHAHGIQVENIEETLQSIAEKYEISPSDLYKIIEPRRDSGRSIMRGKGMRNRIR